ncbi:hypothetical protein N7447_000626 [Penicillium robsamsonii]|uniref:uncharacterized protein n=1 Tax=Penicillium robsamsonii TaxID=1792511 RepID=UPI002547A556|nr:uncharacterized protein N7447_000626 [Penicillium robsamsonii]KAJ5834600.1 hypothetical protein N7447_000626 [Penicillium robsamsonii]
MFDQLVPGIIFVGLSSIGLWHSIPLTGVTPSNSFFWRSLSSLEIAYSIHELRKVHPLVFPHDDATSAYDLLQQLSLHAQQYENARLALEQSAEAASLQINIPGVTASMFDPSSTAMPKSVYVNDGSATELRSEELQQSNPDQNNTLYFTIVTALVLITLMFQIMGFVTASNIKYDIEHLKYNCFGRMRAVQEQFGILMLEIQQFRRENEQVRPVFVHLAESIRNASDDLQHCLLHLVGMMENKYTSGIIDLDAKLEKVSEQHQGLMKNTESFPHIPRQLAWLNILLAKTMYPDTELPDELRVEQPDFDLNIGPTERVGLA